MGSRTSSRSAPADASRRRALKALVGIGATGAAASVVYAAGRQRSHIEVTRLAVPVAGLPPALAGVRIALISDLHRSDLVPRTLIDHAVDLTVAERPDLVALLGDYVSFRERTYVDDVAEGLGALQAPFGVFAVMGNHDNERHLAKALARHRVEVLLDARTTVALRHERLDLVGIRYWTRRPRDIQPLLSGARGVPLLLAHDPRRLWAAATLGVPLVLSGHTHGGQVVLPGLGAVAARKFPVVSGLGRAAGTSLFVTRGIGTVYVPVRLNCPPEVAVLTLTPADATA